MNWCFETFLILMVYLNIEDFQTGVSSHLSPSNVGKLSEKGVCLYTLLAMLQGQSLSLPPYKCVYLVSFGDFFYQKS